MDVTDPRIIQYIRSRDPEERMKAVRALGQVHSAEALRYLATIYAQDPDDLVRDLALQAGRHVKKMRAAAHWVGEGIQERDLGDDNFLDDDLLFDDDLLEE